VPHSYFKSSVMITVIFHMMYYLVAYPVISRVRSVISLAPLYLEVSRVRLSKESTIVLV